MPKRVLCKFFAQRACFKGEHCDYSHDLNSPSKNVCTYYQKGICSFGDRCRFEHVKVPKTDSYASSSSAPAVSSCVSRKGHNSATIVQGSVPEMPAATEPLLPTSRKASNERKKTNTLPTGGVAKLRDAIPENVSICSLAASGDCPRGDKCSQIHGDLCPSCGLHCLHPFREVDRDEHLESCVRKQKHMEALRLSEEIECSVCLDRVLSKPTPAERKFGMLSECDHPFCISCIRNWRNSCSSSGVDANPAVRGCPICRKVSYFVIPSVVWYTTKEEKQVIVDNYKAKLRSIDCKHFDFGNGNCPFGSSCFYNHTVRPGSYTWRHNRPPPRRQTSSHFDVMDMVDFGELCDFFEHLMEDELDIFDFADQDDFYDSDYMLMHSGFAVFDPFSDDDDYEL